MEKVQLTDALDMEEAREGELPSRQENKPGDVGVNTDHRTVWKVHLLTGFDFVWKIHLLTRFDTVWKVHRTAWKVRFLTASSTFSSMPPSSSPPNPPLASATNPFP
jgi:hypothetical protein